MGDLLRQYLADANMKQNQLAKRCKEITSIKVNTSIISKMVNDEHFGEGVDVISRYLQAVLAVFIAEHVITSLDQVEELVKASPLRLKEKGKAEAEIAKLLAYAAKAIEEYTPKYFTGFTECIGRVEDINEVVSILLQPHSGIRLVTLVGPPGVGKTELASQITNHPKVRESNYYLLARTIGRTDTNQNTGVEQNVSLKGMEDLLTDIRKLVRDADPPPDKGNLLFVLDNCDFIEIDGEVRRLLHEFLDEFGQLTLLAIGTRPFTLRKKNKKEIEYVKQVKPLGYPNDKEIYEYTSQIEYLHRHPEYSPGYKDELFKKLRTFDAVEMFRQVAEKSTESSQEPFRLTEQNIIQVSLICQSLSGLPLAILIVAGAVGSAGFEKVVKMVGEGNFLTIKTDYSYSQYHDTLTALVEKSYNLLNKEEQTLLRRLGVFVSTCHIDAATYVCNFGDFPQAELVYNCLMRLKNKGLISFEDGWVEYSHNIIAHFARGKLIDSIGQNSEDENKESLKEAKQLLEQCADYYYFSVSNYMLTKYENLPAQASGKEKTLKALRPDHERLHTQMDNILAVEKYIFQKDIGYIEEELKKQFGEQYSRYEQLEEEIRQAVEARGDTEMTYKEEIRLLEAGAFIFAIRKQLWLRDELPYPLLLWMQFLGRRRVDDGYRQEIVMTDF